MKIYEYEVTFQEVPDNLSLTFFVHGCKLNCPDCSWKNYSLTPEDLSLNRFEKILQHHKELDFITFLGGEWEKDIIEYYKIAKMYKFKIVLYTGLNMDEFNKLYPEQLKYLSAIKVGRWIKELGPLWTPNTNQKFIWLDQVR